MATRAAPTDDKALTIKLVHALGLEVRKLSHRVSQLSDKMQDNVDATNSIAQDLGDIDWQLDEILMGMGVDTFGEGPKPEAGELDDPGPSVDELCTACKGMLHGVCPECGRECSCADGATRCG